MASLDSQGIIYNDKRACVYRHGFTWTKSRLFVELTTQQLHQVHTKRGPTENSVHFPAAHLLGMRKDLSEHDEETQLC